MILLAILIVIPIVLVLVIFPLLGYIFLKQPAHPTFEEWPLEKFPHRVQQYFSQVIPVLEDEGFHVICFCGQTTPSTEYFVLLKHQEKRDIVTVMSGLPCDSERAWKRFIEFTSEIHDTVIKTNNNPRQPVLASQPDNFKRYNFPNKHDLHELYLLHRALLQRHAGNAAPGLWKDGMELERFKRVFMREPEEEVRRGNLYFDPTLNAYRPTLKEAFITGSLTPVEFLLFWPFGRLRNRVLSRRMDRVVEEIAEAKQVAPKGASNQQNSAEQRRTQQEQREREQSATFLSNEASADYPILRETHQSLGFMVDLDETFRDAPVKPAVGMPEGIVYLFLPLAALLTPAAIKIAFKTWDTFVQTLPIVAFKTLMILLFWAVAALVSGIATIRFSLWIIHAINAFRLLAQHGRVTTAVIIELCRHEDSGTFSGTPTEYTMLYRFQATHVSGVTTTITGRERISEDVYETYHTQKTVDVRYVPKRPELFKLQLWTRKDFRRRL